MKISKYFTRNEMRCRCGCGFDTIDAQTLKIADEVREFLGYAITPTSAARCIAYNRLIGSTDKSQHVLGRAIDLPVKNPKEVYDFLCKKYPDNFGFGLYENFVHIDTRLGQKARW